LIRMLNWGRRERLRAILSLIIYDKMSDIANGYRS